MTWYTLILWNDYLSRFLNTFLHSLNYSIFCLVRTFKVYSLTNFQLDTAVLVTIITIVYIWFPELLPLTTGNVFFGLIPPQSTKPRHPLCLYYFGSFFFFFIVYSTRKWGLSVFFLSDLIYWANVFSV